MNRQAALILIIFIFFIFNLICYYGIKITILSSLVFSTFTCLILLFLFYPPDKIISDPSDFTLIIYSVLVILGIVFLAFYIACNTLMDVRCVC
jgi:hypothetical protein